MPFIQTQRGRHFFRQAPGEYPTLLFLHGNLGSSRWWRPMLDLLPQGWRGIAPDAIGYGYSEAGEQSGRFSIASQVSDLASLQDALDIQTVHIVAHSSATAVAIDYTLTYPDRVDTLILVGPVPASGVTTPPEAYPLLERLPDDVTLLAQALHSSIPTLDPTSDFFRQLLDDAGRISPEAFSASAHELDSWRLGEHARQLTLPVLLVRGEKDIMLSEEEAHQTLLAIPGANNLEVIRGIGHTPMVESPKALLEVLVRFISEDWDGYQAVRHSATE